MLWSRLKPQIGKSLLCRDSAVVCRGNYLAQRFISHVACAVESGNRSPHPVVGYEIAGIVSNVEIFQKTADGIGADLREDAFHIERLQAACLCVTDDQAGDSLSVVFDFRGNGVLNDLDFRILLNFFYGNLIASKHISAHDEIDLVR